MPALPVLLTVTALAPMALPATPLWLQTRDARALSPLMALASRVGLGEADALGDFLVPLVTASAEQPAPDCWAEYSLTVPKAGSYWCWARVRFPAALFGRNYCLAASLRLRRRRCLQVPGDGEELR